MKVLRWHGKRDLRLEEIEKPQPDQGTVLVKVMRAGICGTDLSEYWDGASMICTEEPHPITGYLGPVVLGHEFSGIIERCGPGLAGQWKEGDRVCVMPMLYCGKCQYCRSGLFHLCQEFGIIGLNTAYGGFGEYCVVPEGNLIRVPDSVTFEQAACQEPLSDALYGIRRSRMSVGDRVLITGGNPPAMLTLMSAQAAGASEIYLAYPGGASHSQMREWGATDIFSPGTTVERVMAATDGFGVDVAIDCTGDQSAMREALSSLRKRGMYVQCRMPEDGAALPAADLLLKDLSLTGLWCCNTHDMELNMRLVESGRIQIEKVVTKVVRIENLKEAFDTLLDGESGDIKIQVSFE